MAALPDTLTADGLVLSRWDASDVDNVLDAVWASFEELRQWMDWAQRMPTREEQEAALRAGSESFDAGTGFGFVFREAATGEVVGAGGLHRRVGPGAVEIGYWVRTDRHNRGYATAATRAMTEAAFQCLDDVDRIEIHMDVANVASRRVPEKLGYRLVRTEDREKLAIGHTGRGHVWEMTRQQWQPSAGGS